MGFSVNTNASAMSALLNLNKSTRSLTEVQTRINTGLSVSSAKENAAVYSIAQKLRADLQGYSAVKHSLDRGVSTVGIALAAAESISDLLINMKEKAVAAADEGIAAADRVAHNEDFIALRDQIKIMVQNANFNETNLIDGGADIVKSITDAEASNHIEIAHQNLSLGGANVTITATDTIATQTAALAMVATIKNSIANVNVVLTKFGAGARTLESQRVFADKISDSIEIGIGNLVDANMAKESARLQALQVKQQLGVQALSIANREPQSILSLFK
jgi:flagellin